MKEIIHNDGRFFATVDIYENPENPLETGPDYIHFISRSTCPGPAVENFGENFPDEYDSYEYKFYRFTGTYQEIDDPEKADAYIYITKEDVEKLGLTKQMAHKLLDILIKDYNEYLEGNCYVVNVYDSDEQIDTKGSYKTVFYREECDCSVMAYGYKYAIEVANEMIKEYELNVR